MRSYIASTSLVFLAAAGMFTGVSLGQRAEGPFAQHQKALCLTLELKKDLLQAAEVESAQEDFREFVGSFHYTGLAQTKDGKQLALQVNAVFGPYNDVSDAISKPIFVVGAVLLNGSMFETPKASYGMMLRTNVAPDEVLRHGEGVDLRYVKSLVDQTVRKVGSARMTCG
jgi:hypothetical protein